VRPRTEQGLSAAIAHALIQLRQFGAAALRGEAEVYEAAKRRRAANTTRDIE
jgi:hypothetical protein